MDHPIREYRARNNLSRAQLAETLGCSKHLITSVETGHRSITAEKAVQWEQIIGIRREVLRPDLFQRVNKKRGA